MRYSDLEQELRDFFLKQRVTSSTFNDFIHSIELRTTERERSSEAERLTRTPLESSFVVWTALSALKRLSPTLQLSRVLIVDPGPDSASRANRVDSPPLETYQPFALADALIGLGLANRDQLEIHCIGIQDPVIEFLNAFPRRDIRKLTILTGLEKPQWKAESGDYRRYFEKLGKRVAAEVPSKGVLPDSTLKKSLLIRRDVAERVTAERMNIVTERYEPSPGYDLVVVTNVFHYFSPSELALALSNIHSILRKNGYLVHNELRPEVETFSRDVALEPIQSRTLRPVGGHASPLTEGFVIHKKSF